MSKHAAGPMRRRKRRRQLLSTLVLCAALILVTAVSTGWALSALKPPLAAGPAPDLPTDTPPVEPAPAPEPPQPVVTKVQFSASGDNLIHAPIYKQAARRASPEEGYRFDECYQYLTPLYQQQDVNWINQETLCTRELEPSSYPCFSTPGQCPEALYRAGMRVFSLANNHTYDKGAVGIGATLRFWESMPSDVITTGLWRGEDDYTNIPLHTVNDIRIAYLSYTEHTNGIPQNDKMPAHILYTSQLDQIQQQIETAAQIADFVVVGVHWGVENSHTITQAQQTLAQQLADWGADLILGTHPHVLQDAQWLTAADGRTAFVAYSLGNLISTQSKPDQLIGAILTIQLEKTVQPNGTVELTLHSPLLHPIVTHYDAGKSNVRSYLYSDYTAELAKQHGVRAEHNVFDFEYIRSVAEKTIQPEFLSLS